MVLGIIPNTKFVYSLWDYHIDSPVFLAYFVGDY